MKVEKKKKIVIISLYSASIVYIIIFIIVILSTWATKSFIFAPYTIPVPDNEKTFKPLGTITPLTPDEIQDRNEQINKAIGND